MIIDDPGIRLYQKGNKSAWHFCFPYKIEEKI